MSKFLAFDREKFHIAWRETTLTADSGILYQDT